ncbi:penicillin-binding transpeptidase domain-containing protein [Gemmiger formicilis]|uniref:penicillin-binding transpeptidase domain-containing protein n=1 Tax=Gemmiger formicilis TaxID=745368 RepID=UPI0035210691
MPGRPYRCALGRAHGVVNLRGALEQSCNTYFIELGRLLGAQRIRKMAETLGFGTATQLAPGLQGASGTLPDAAALENPGELATFSFGQGGADRDAAANYSHDEHRRKRRRVQDTGLCTGNC